jgi:hypothetical protein
MVWSGGEVHLCGRCGCGIIIIWADISRAECPDAIDGQWLPAGILQQPVKFSGRQIVGGNESARLGISATRKLPDGQVRAEASEIKRSESHAPRSVQPITMLETLQGGGEKNYKRPRNRGPGRPFQRANLPRGAHK